MAAGKSLRTVLTRGGRRGSGRVTAADSGTGSTRHPQQKPNACQQRSRRVTIQRIERSSGASFSHAAERRVHVRIASPEPIAEGWAQQRAIGCGRRALHHHMLAIEEVRRVLRIRRTRFESRERREDRAGPFPSVAHEILDPPPTLPARVCARRLWIPTREVEYTASRV